MREIKFRLIYHGKIVGYERHEYNKENDHITIFHNEYNIEAVEGAEVQHSHKDQFTGLLDKNGVEIYEGDIIEMPYTWYESTGPERNIEEEGVYRGEVVLWPSCGVRIKRPYRYTIEDGKIKHSTHVGISAYISKVIGNIHQHPELLEKP